MKRKFIALFIVVLILLLPTMINTFSKVMMPDKVLHVGHGIDKYSGEFTREIKDEKKISEFEQLCEEVIFSEEEWNEEKPADLVFKIDHKEGIYTHFLEVWINQEGAIMSYGNDWENNMATIGELSKSQFEKLESIIE